MKKFMSTKMKIFISVLATIFIGSYILAAIVLFNSNYKLTNYIDNIPFSIDTDWDGFELDLDFDSNYSRYNDSRTLGINSDLDKIYIDTTSSDIDIQFYNENFVKLDIDSKISSHANFDSLINKFTIENNNLYISTNESFFNHVKDLNLTIYVPSTFKNNLSVITTSGDVNLTNGNFNNLSINSTSSDIDLSNISSNNTTISTTSGDISSHNSYLGNVTIESTSGDMDLNLINLDSNNKFNTTSGDIDLELPDNLGYCLNFDTVSGSFSNKNGTKTDKSISNYTIGDGSKKISISTTSGDSEIK